MLDLSCERRETLRRVSLVLLLLGVALSPARAQGTALVAPTDLVYRDLDRLAELGVLDSVIIGQRPYSRREIRRIASAAAARVARDASLEGHPGVAGAVRAVLVRIDDRISNGTAGTSNTPATVRPMDDVTLALSTTSAERRRLVGFGRETEATIDPLAERRLGRPALRGATAALELSHRIEPFAWLAIQARERIELRHPRDGTASRTDGELLLGTVRARRGNVAVTLGREQIAWSQQYHDGLFLASNGPALDQISLAGDAPFVLPGFLRTLGSTQATFLFADLGASKERPHSKLLAYKVSVQPARALELGAIFMNHFGGEGSPRASVLDRLIDFVPIVDVFRRHNYKDTTRTLDVESDKLLGFDGRLRMARLGGVVVTGEMLVDDVDAHRIRTLFTWDGSQTVGVIVPSVVLPSVALRLSAKHMGIRSYTHGQLPNGITTRGRLLGDELGPDAKQFGALIRWSASGALDLALAGEAGIYSKADYAPNDDDGVLRIPKARVYPNELRERLVASLVLHRERAVDVTARAGGERTRNAAFAGGTRHDYVAELAIRVTP